MSKHTRGPWTVNIHDAPLEMAQIIAPDGMQIGGVDIAGRRPEDMANAALIAASPEMLEALRYGVSWFEKHCPQAPTTDGGVIPHPMLESFRAAIAKAEAKP